MWTLVTSVVLQAPRFRVTSLSTLPIVIVLVLAIFISSQQVWSPYNAFCRFLTSAGRY